MRIQLPFNIPFEIVGHRPGQPLGNSGSRIGAAAVVRSYLPIQLRRTGRPAWAGEENFRHGDAAAASATEAPTAISARAGMSASALATDAPVGHLIEHPVDHPLEPAAQSPASHSPATTHRTEVASAEHLLAQNLAELAAWVDSGPPIERQERLQVAAFFAECWTNLEVTKIHISRKNHITSLPPIPPKLTQLNVWMCESIVTPPVLAGHPRLKDLSFMACGSLTQLSDVSHCSELKTYTVQDCDGIVEPPDLTGCRKLINIGFLGCTNFQSLPAISECPELEVLDITDCTHLAGPVDLSANTRMTTLMMGGCRQVDALNLTGCDQLKSIFLQHCTGLATIPSVGHLQQLDYLNMRGIPFTSLPDDIVTLSPDCDIQVDASRLSDAVRNRLTHIMNAPDYAGPRITYSMHRAQNASEAPPVGEAVAAWRAEAPPHLQVSLSGFDWHALPSQDNVRAFSSFLVRIRETNDYNRASPELKAATQQRVAALLVQMQSDPVLRENCFNLATDAVDTCGDRVALRMLDMENCAVISAARAAIVEGKYDHNPEALVDVCKGQHRLKIIAKEAENKVATMHFTDPIEVHLGYLTKLAEPYRLPVQIRTMLYPACSSVTSDDLAAVSKQCANDGLSRAECAINDKAYLHALATSDLMQGLLERLQPVQMQAANVEVDRLIGQAQHNLYEELDALDPSAVNFAQKNRQLKAAFNTIETDIKVRTTLPVLQSFLQTHRLDSALGNVAPGSLMQR